MKQDLDNLLKNYKQNLTIICVSQKISDDINISKELQTQSLDKIVVKKMYYNHFSIGVPYEKDWDSLFLNLKNKILLIQKDVIFIIFNEYFFGKVVFNEDKKNLLFKTIGKHFNKNTSLKYIFIFVNLLVQEQPIEPNNMIIYSKDINISYHQIWSSTTNYKILYENDNKSNWYSNTTFIVYNGNPIISYKKSSFANEGKLQNYIFGTGKLEILVKCPESISIQNRINVYTCMDITVKPYYNLIKDLDCEFCGDEDVLNDFNNLKTYLEENTKNDDSQKEINIIMSNTISINPNILFKNNCIIVQVDPENNFVTEIKYSKYLEKVLSQTKINHEKLLKKISSQHFPQRNGELIRKYNLFMLKYNYFQVQKVLLEGNTLGCGYPKDSEISNIKFSTSECLIHIYNKLDK